MFLCPFIKVANSNIHLSGVLLWRMFKGQSLLFSVEGGIFCVFFGHSTPHSIFTLVTRILS